MTKDELNKILATYIVAIGPDKVPNTHVWLAVDPQMSDLDKHMIFLGALKKAGLVIEKFNCLELTSDGLVMYAKIRGLMKPKTDKVLV